MNLIFKYAKLNIHENFNIPHVLGLIYTQIHILVHILFRVSYRSPLSKQAQLSNNLSIAVFRRDTHPHIRTCTYHFLAIFTLLKKRVTRESRNQTNHPRQTAGGHLLRSPCYLLRKTRGSEISSPFTAIPLSTTFSLSSLHPLFSSAARIHDTFGGATANGNNVAVLRSSASSRELYQL